MTNNSGIGIGLDLAGVLLVDGFPLIVSECEREYGLKNNKLQLAKNKNWPSFALGDINHREFWSRTFAEVGIELTNKDIDEINTRVVEAHTPLETLDYAKKIAAEHTVGVITNCPQKWLGIWDNKYMLTDTFAPVIASYNVHMLKPNERVYLLLCQKMGLPPEKVHYFDDQSRNVEAAQKMGLNAYVVSPGVNPLLNRVDRL